uniref:NADH-ubiquinone oxidoreductase chain 3 n=2 Tax=Magnusiomyces TaxID=1095182 RepID=A0A6B9INL7_9ASCO|nr:NADH dehydrogenase subunit 3 [Magnusiomyces ingens]YP_010180071.1 NADH dehydrogenase subunit 3 [Saprochaete ingens]AHY04905.1 NADH dehydrogenase subunit 3 [Magnusiomyces ingens]QGZ08693.1 NADH dehydrogenase subunit 3 [Saprochaete ingens]QUX32915.1 NADH dehydrogenase subunit 3 [Magnusiomyces ingens]QUX32939.1 NADH dehydrogenase subunit 3 [Saprochaete ingens]
MFNNLTLYMFMMLMPIVGLALLVVNILFSETNTYSDKTGPFECGLSSFTQTRIAFTVSFILIAILFLPFDLEVTSILPYSLALYHTNSYGLSIIILFILLLTIGFIYEINNKALYIIKNNIKYKSDHILTLYL